MSEAPSFQTQDHPFLLVKKSYSIYDSADNEDTVHKTKVMLARGLAVGSVTAVCEMIGFSKPTTPLTMLGRYCTVALPIAAMATSYPAMVCISANIRNKDDVFNHFVGGFVSGTMLGTRMKSPKVAWGAGFALGLVGAGLKCFAIEGAEFNTHTYKSRGFFNQYQHTFVPGMQNRKLEPMDSNS